MSPASELRFHPCFGTTLQVVQSLVTGENGSPAAGSNRGTESTHYLSTAEHLERSQRPGQPGQEGPAQFLHRYMCGAWLRWS